MGFIIALFVVPFVTLPSIIYSISYFVLFFLITYIIVLYTLVIGRRSTFLRERSAIRGDRITSKVLPIFLIIVVPIILYFYTWKLAGWIFFAWMIIYFLNRRFSGVSRWHMQITQQRKEAEKILDNLDDKLTMETNLKKTPKMVLIGWLIVSAVLIAVWELLVRIIPEGWALVPVNISCFLASLSIGAFGYLPAFRRWMKYPLALLCAVALYFVVFGVIRGLLWAKKS